MIYPKFLVSIHQLIRITITRKAILLNARLFETTFSDSQYTLSEENTDCKNVKS